MELTDEEQLVVEQLAEEQSQKQLAADRERDRERQLEWAKNFRRRFPPGQSGNPSGRPKGARNRVTLAMEAVFDAETETIILQLVHKAKVGDAGALRLCVDRLLAPTRARMVEFDLPAIDTAADAPKAFSTVMAECAAGDLSIAEARDVVKMIDTHVRLIEACDLEKRIIALEHEQWP